MTLNLFCLHFFSSKALLFAFAGAISCKPTAPAGAGGQHSAAGPVPNAAVAQRNSPANPRKGHRFLSGDRVRDIY